MYENLINFNHFDATCYNFSIKRRIFLRFSLIHQAGLVATKNGNGCGTPKFFRPLFTNTYGTKF